MTRQPRPADGLPPSQEDSEGRRTRRVFLVGMMGAGKSTVAGLLAERLGWPAVDTDAVVEERAGMAVAEVFARQGEAVFRAAEERAVAELAGSASPVVVSVGGGAVLSPASRQVMKHAGTVVWLRAGAATLAGRVGRGATRPLLALPPEAPPGDKAAAIVTQRLAELLAAREPFYEEVADLVVDVDSCPPAEVAEQVASALGGGGGA